MGFMRRRSWAGLIRGKKRGRGGEEWNDRGWFYLRSFRGRGHTFTSLSPAVDAVGVSSKHPAGPLPPTSETLLAAISDFLTDRGPITFTPSSLSLSLDRC